MGAMVVARRPTVWEVASTRCHVLWRALPGKLMVCCCRREGCQVWWVACVGLCFPVLCLVCPSKNILEYSFQHRLALSLSPTQRHRPRRNQPRRLPTPTTLPQTHHTNTHTSCCSPPRPSETPPASASVDAPPPPSNNCATNPPDPAEYPPPS